jgi:hypothetical protein
MLYHSSEVQFMSYRNGDKSREHRLRKAREKKRAKYRETLGKSDAQSATPAAKK